MKIKCQLIKHQFSTSVNFVNFEMSKVLTVRVFLKMLVCRNLSNQQNLSEYSLVIQNMNVKISINIGAGLVIARLRSS